jgi:subtilisin family serine protease
MLPEQAEALSLDDRVQFVEEDSAMYAATTETNAPWNLDRVDQRNLPLNTTFDYTQSGAGAHVYILDTGIRITHQEFGGRASVAFDALNDGQNGIDCNGHGTHVAGTAAGATYGVAKSALVHSVRVLPCTGGGQISDLISGIDWLTAHRVNPAVANISITAPGTSSALESAITNSIASGITFTIAAGNQAWDACDYTPARTPNAITVGATADDDFRPNYSNYGACLDIYAPGHMILSAGINNDSDSRTLSGTSMSAPLVAGVAAVYLGGHTSATPSAVALALTSSATIGAVTNLDPASPNKLLYSPLGGAAPTPTPTVTPTPTPSATPTPTPVPTPSNGRLTIRKRANSTSGGTSSTIAFPYDATNIPTNTFTLLSDQEFSDNNVPSAGQTVQVTEESVDGWSLVAVDCVESGGASVPNTTVDLAGHTANIKVESGETVTCTFTSEPIAPTAAVAAISGRVVDARGRGVRGLSLSVFNASTGEMQFTRTNSMGFYSFQHLEVANFYVVTAYGSKGLVVADNVRTFRLDDNLFNVNFVAARE